VGGSSAALAWTRSVARADARVALCALGVAIASAAVVATLDHLATQPLSRVEVFVLLCCAAVDCILVWMFVHLRQRDGARRRDLERLQRAVRDMAVVEERNRLAREIHDGLGGVLSSVAIQSDYLLNMIDGSEVRAKLTGSSEARAAIVPVIRKEIADLHAAVQDSMDELRRSLRMMQEDFDLVATLHDACKVAAARQRLDVRFTRAGRDRVVGPERALALFRVLQESLTNVAKHCGRGTIVDVSLTFGARTATLAVQDRGPGFVVPPDAAAATSGHYGLMNMRERAAKVRGELAILSSPGRGTRVELTVHAAEEQER
jgi:two-component system, NarL family, sensor histidine kinase DegS